jgi:hypothetical protein
MTAPHEEDIPMEEEAHEKHIEDQTYEEDSNDENQVTTLEDQGLVSHDS